MSRSTMGRSRRDWREGTVVWLGFVQVAEVIQKSVFPVAGIAVLDRTRRFRLNLRFYNAGIALFVKLPSVNRLVRKLRSYAHLL